MPTLRRTFAGLVIAAALGTAALGAATPAFCADAATPAPSAQNLDLARRLFAGMHMDQMMGDMMKNMAPAMIAQERRANPNLSDAQAQAVMDVVSQSSQLMMSKIMDRMIPLYASTFSEKELRDAVAFYEGPSGQAMLSKMPVLMSRMGPMIVDMMPELQADMRARLCSTTASAAACASPAPPAAPKG